MELGPGSISLISDAPPKGPDTASHFPPTEDSPTDYSGRLSSKQRLQALRKDILARLNRAIELRKNNSPECEG